MKQKWNIAIAQLDCAEGNKEQNLQKIEWAIEQAHAQGAELLILPELILTGFVNKTRMLELAEMRKGPSMKRIQEKLVQYPLHVLYSFPELAGEQIVYNTSCLLNPRGEALEYYRKIHAFNDERQVFNSGNEWAVANVEGVKMGMLTCFDIEFPEASRTLALKGAKLLLVNSANMEPYEYHHRTFSLARAMENHCFVAYCNRVGANRRHTYHGQSAVISPTGKVLLDLGDDVEAVRTVEIDLEEVNRSKEVFNYLEERRSELYG